MCAIVGSFSRDKLIELVKLNSYRGSHSYSFSTFNIITNELKIYRKGFGELEDHKIVMGSIEYGIAHIQAPTTEEKDLYSVHPAQENDTYLWHNGIIKANYVTSLQERFGKDTKWDTKLLLRAVNSSRDEICNMDGSFSCLWYACSGAYLFRNDISPMFFDSDLNISSTKFANSSPTASGAILKMDFLNRSLYNTGFTFKTVENPYYFGAE